MARRDDRRGRDCGHLVDWPALHRHYQSADVPKDRQLRSLGIKGQSYSSAALIQDLREVSEVWGRVQNTRDRRAIYGYLEAVYRLVRRWTRQGHAKASARRALRLLSIKRDLDIEPFSIVIFCSSEGTVDFRMRSKWSRVLRYAASYEIKAVSLTEFIGLRGGINACAKRFARNARGRRRG